MSCQGHNLSNDPSHPAASFVPSQDTTLQQASLLPIVIPSILQHPPAHKTGHTSTILCTTGRHESDQQAQRRQNSPTSRHSDQPRRWDSISWFNRQFGIKMAALTIEELDTAVRNFYEGHGGPEVRELLVQSITCANLNAYSKKLRNSFSPRSVYKLAFINRG